MSRPRLLRGGLATGYSPRQFAQDQLLFGTLVELEHTNDPEVAQLIAMDHLVEHPDYYLALAEMESRLEKNGHSSSRRHRTIGSRRRGR